MGDDTWEELPRQVTDPYLVKPGPTWLIIKRDGKLTARTESRARAIERQLGRDWVRTHFIDTSADVRRPVRLRQVAWASRMTSTMPRGRCGICHGYTDDQNPDIVLVRLTRPGDKRVEECWVHISCAVDDGPVPVVFDPEETS